MPLWINNFNKQFDKNPRIDVCLVVIEKRERVDQTIVLAMELLDLTIENMKADNLVIVFNKADEDEDNFESVMQFYKEAYEQAKCKNMPKVQDLQEKDILLLYKQKMGAKTRPIEDCYNEASALFDYTQGIVVPFIVEKLKTAK